MLGKEKKVLTVKLVPEQLLNWKELQVLHQTLLTQKIELDLHSYLQVRIPQLLLVDIGLR